MLGRRPRDRGLPVRPGHVDRRIGELRVVQQRRDRADPVEARLGHVLRLAPLELVDRFLEPHHPSSASCSWSASASRSNRSTFCFSREHDVLRRLVAEPGVRELLRRPAALVLGFGQSRLRSRARSASRSIRSPTGRRTVSPCTTRRAEPVASRGGHELDAAMRPRDAATSLLEARRTGLALLPCGRAGSRSGSSAGSRARSGTAGPWSRAPRRTARRPRRRHRAPRGRRTRPPPATARARSSRRSPKRCQISSVTNGITGCRSRSVRSRIHARTFAASVAHGRVLRPQPLLLHLETPVAELGPEEPVHGLRGRRELVAIERRVHLGDAALVPREQPALRRREPILRRELRLAARERPAGRAARRSRSCSRSCGPLGSSRPRAGCPAARRSRAARARTAARRLRGDRTSRSGRSRCRATSTSCGRAPSRTSPWITTSRKGMSPASDMPGHDHPRDPEVEDLVARHEDRVRIEARGAPACRPASRASRTARAATRTTCRARPGPARAPPTRTWRTRPGPRGRP